MDTLLFLTQLITLLGYWHWVGLGNQLVFEDDTANQHPQISIQHAQFSFKHTQISPLQSVTPIYVLNLKLAV